MIHVTAQHEPDSFDAKVRQKGRAWLQKKAIPLDQPLPPKTRLEPYWRQCLDELHTSYDGCCAYLAMYLVRATGGVSVDHYISKSHRPDMAYEWSNYRLASLRMNSRKRDYDDVLDPFEVDTGWFRLELVTGRVYPNPQLPVAQKREIQTTIDRLGLDDDRNREERASHYQEYGKGQYTVDHLKKHSPFAWSEAERQGLL